jgi:hypothetical protein
MSYLDAINRITTKVITPGVVGAIFRESPIFNHIRRLSRVADANTLYNVATYDYGYKGWTAMLSGGTNGRTR